MQPMKNRGDPIQALLDDLDRSIADFDQRLENNVADKPAATVIRSPESTFPAIDPEARRQPAATPVRPAPAPAAPAAPPSEAAPALDLLAELAEAAASRSEDDAQEQQRLLARVECLHQDLKSIFDYLNQLVRHANALKPAVPRGFRLDLRNSFNDLAWHEGFIDYRSTGRFDRSYYEQVLFQVRYQAPQALTAVCPEDQAPILRKELGLVNLAIVREEPVVLPEGASGIRFVLPEAIPLHLSVRADFDAGALIFRCRNAGGFGLFAYRLPGGCISRPLLDGIGLVLLGRSGSMPKELQPIPYPREN